MKLDFEENEGKQEIKIAELLSKLKEKDGIIDSQASVKRDLEDDIEALKKRIAILTRKNSELDTNLQELTNINTALEKIENYKAEIEIALQENIKTLKNNEEIQKKLTDIPKEINGIVNENKKKIDAEIYNKAIREYFYSKKKNTLKLYEYAKKLNIYNKVRDTFAVLS